MDSAFNSMCIDSITVGRGNNTLPDRGTLAYGQPKCSCLECNTKWNCNSIQCDSIIYHNNSSICNNRIYGIS